MRKIKNYLIGFGRVVWFLIGLALLMAYRALLKVGKFFVKLFEKGLIYLAYAAGVTVRFLKKITGRDPGKPIKLNKFPKEIPCEQCKAPARRSHDIWRFKYQGRDYMSTMWHYKCTNPACGKLYTTDETRNRTANALMRTVNGGKL